LTKEIVVIKRMATIKRATKETNISLELVIDGKGDFEITTGMQMFDHLLAQLARHGVFDLKVSATGADPHHLVEDVALCLGRAFNQALGGKKGIVRMAHAMVPMDDALALVAVDIGGRGYAVIEVPFDEKNIADLPADLVRHFLETFASEARINLHTKLIRGSNDHHKAEAVFKALARALDGATQLDERIKDRVPSTKEVIES
jgi:imidazoleglycerol-phosphate dehydratase